MAPPLHLSTLLSDKISPAMRYDIVNNMLNLCLSKKEFDDRFSGIDACFNEWYDQPCKLCAHGVSINTHGELLEVVSYLRSNQFDRQAVLQMLCQSEKGSVATVLEHEATIDLAAQVLIGMSIGSTPSCVLLVGESLSWTSGSLQKSVSEHFRPSCGAFEDINLPRNFTAANLERIAGIKVNWTTNLVDHLLLKDAETRDAMVMIFHPISFLKLHKLSDYDIISNSIVEETISTLKLLLPSNDDVLKAWFKHERRRHKDELDGTASACGHFQTRDRKIENFSIWKERLVILKQAFDDSEPKTLWQRWYDDRKKGEWYTFWLAVLIAFLTVLTVVFGIIQCWASIRALSQ